MRKKAYSFSIRSICASTKYEIDALCVFFDTKRPVTELDFFDELEASLKSVNTLPDCVVVIAEEKGLKRLCDYWKKLKPQQKIFQQRGIHKGKQFIKGYFFVTLFSSSQIHVEHENIVISGWNFVPSPEDVVDKGLEALVTKNPVIHAAPAGHVFKHPSKSTNKLFIKARELAMSEAELVFVGWCLSHKLAPLLGDQDSAQVFIDTMGIYPFVREALTLLESKASIHSYHSYTNLSELSPPREPYAVVISASTSGSMAKKLHNEQGFESDKIITLIDTSKEERTGYVMVALDDIDPSYSKQIADGSQTQIELVGEHFSLKSRPPRAVTLSTSHQPQSLPVFLKNFGLKGLLDLNARPAEGNTERFILLDGSIVCKNKNLRDWLGEEIAWNVASAIDHVLYANDADSEVLAKEAAKKLNDAKATRTNKDRVKLVGYGSLDENRLKSAKGVLVVQAIAGSGGLLREISRDLREFIRPDIPRHFLVGVGLPKNKATWKDLRKFLVKNSSNREYGFSVWLNLPIGSDAWKSLSDLIAAAQMQSGSHENDTESLNALKECITKSHNKFLPTSSNVELRLSEGFVFFGDVFRKKWDKVPVSTIYATIAAVLQSARDCENSSIQLKSTGYESVVLSPENFLRFNDSILQACILRTAYPSELDYSSSPELSMLMKEFLIKVFNRHKHTYGAAALEFAAALACKKLKLIDKDIREVKNKAELSVSSPNALLGIIHLI